MGGEVSTLSRPVLHRTGSAKQKQQLTTTGVFSHPDINANNTTTTPSNGISYTQLENGFQRVPQQQRTPETQQLTGSETTGNGSTDGENQLKKWSEVCKVEPEANTNSNGDTNNNHSMDYSN